MTQSKIHEKLREGGFPIDEWLDSIPVSGYIYLLEAVFGKSMAVKNGKPTGVWSRRLRLLILGMIPDDWLPASVGNWHLIHTISNAIDNTVLHYEEVADDDAVG